MKKGDKLKVKYFTIGDEGRSVKQGIVEIDAIHDYEHEKYIQLVDDSGSQFSMPYNRVKELIDNDNWELICGCDTCPSTNINL